MSAANQTKIFGVRLGLDPKILILALMAFAGLLFWYNSRGDDTGSSSPTTSTRAETSAPLAEQGGANRSAANPVHKKASRRNVRLSDNTALKLEAIDATKGDIDPTLHLDLLSRVRQVPAAGPIRNLFEVGPAPAETASAIPLPKGPIVPPKPLPPAGGALPGSLPTQPTVDIPLKFYGFMKPGNGQTNRGLFLDGDNILVASEGEVIKQRYLVVELTPNSARMEDTRLKQGQTLPVVPEKKAEDN